MQPPSSRNFAPALKQISTTLATMPLRDIGSPPSVLCKSNVFAVMFLVFGIQIAAFGEVDPVKEAHRHLSGISRSILALQGSPNRADILSKLGTPLIADGARAAVFSAESVLLSKSAEQAITSRWLTTEAYLIANGALGRPVDESLRKHGSAFEVIVVRTNIGLQTSQFHWHIRLDNRQVSSFAFPVMWTKRPDLYGGDRIVADTHGSVQRLPEESFKLLKQAATEWINGSRPLEEIDRMTADPDELTVLNGIMLLSRVDGLDPVLQRLEKILSSTNGTAVGRAIMVLGTIQSSRAVDVIAKALEIPSVSRIIIIKALGSTGQANAVRPLDKLTIHPHLLVRTEVAKALAKIPGAASKAVLDRLAEDKDHGVRAAAVQALKEQVGK